MDGPHSATDQRLGVRIPASVLRENPGRHSLTWAFVRSGTGTKRPGPQLAVRFPESRGTGRGLADIACRATASWGDRAYGWLVLAAFQPAADRALHLPGRFAFGERVSLVPG